MNKLMSIEKKLGPTMFILWDDASDIGKKQSNL